MFYQQLELFLTIADREMRVGKAQRPLEDVALKKDADPAVPRELPFDIAELAGREEGIDQHDQQGQDRWATRRSPRRRCRGIANPAASPRAALRRHRPAAHTARPRDPTPRRRGFFRPAQPSRR